MASTIAGFLTQSRALRGSEFWNSHWPSLINKVDDPYIRAILLKIGGDNWESVLEEEAIPLLDRVAIAMFHLSDKDVGPLVYLYHDGSAFLLGVELTKCS